jgi:hypothetical protein
VEIVRLQTPIKGVTIMGEIPAIMVDKWYEMDPSQEDILFSGRELRDGMIVILASARTKVDLRPRMAWSLVRRRLTNAEWFQARNENRWFRITNIEFVGGDEGLIWYLAHYADGTVRKGVAYTHEAWLVKLDSLRDMYPPDPKLA